MKKMLNIGCGHRYHSDWVNIDVDPSSPEVMKADIIRGLPFSDNSFDVVYHSNVLEHLPYQMGQNMIAECYRVLKPGGIIRISVPDLEKICREYLANMEEAMKGDEEASFNYEWILIELFDQVSRNQTGGEMSKYLSKEHIANPAFLRARLGDYFDNWKTGQQIRRTRKTFIEKIKFLCRHPDRFKRIWYAIVLSKKERLWLSIGKFRLGGEVHYHMYDRYSLGNLLLKKGFKHIEIKTPVESNIPGWPQFNLDYPNDGAGLFAEAIK